SAPPLFVHSRSHPVSSSLLPNTTCRTPQRLPFLPKNKNGAKAPSRHGSTRILRLHGSARRADAVNLQPVPVDPEAPARFGFPFHFMDRRMFEVDDRAAF